MVRELALVGQKGKRGRPRVWTEETVYGEIDALLDYVENFKTYGVPYPLLEDFCVRRGYGHSRLSEWCKDESFPFTVKRELTDAIELCKHKATSLLSYQATTAANKATIVGIIFTLQNVGGWKNNSPAVVNNNQISVTNNAGEKPLGSNSRAEDDDIRGRMREELSAAFKSR